MAPWIYALALKTGERVYHLGCGVGYYTAILAKTVGPNRGVVGVELQPELAAKAKTNLATYANVRVEAADGAAFDPGECDVILVNCGVTHRKRFGWTACGKARGLSHRSLWRRVHRSGKE